jgi:hypothetical protein
LCERKGAASTHARAIALRRSGIVHVMAISVDLAAKPRERAGACVFGAENLRGTLASTGNATLAELHSATQGALLGAARRFAA